MKYIGVILYVTGSAGAILVEGLFRYNAHFIITLFSLGSHNERYNEVAVYSATTLSAPITNKQNTYDKKVISFLSHTGTSSSTDLRLQTSATLTKYIQHHKYC